jgi:two-component system, cell cycle sensor histidine kinase and response regulator CckA
MKTSIKLPNKMKTQIIATFSGIILFLAVCIYVYYSFESRSLYDAAAQNIQAIANLKISQIAQWRKERLANARTTFQSPLLADALETWLAHRDNTILKQKILDRLNVIQREYRYVDIFIVSPETEVLLSHNGTSDKLGPKGRQFIENDRDNDDIFERDFFISSRDNAIYYDIIAPLHTTKNRLLGYLVFRTNPEEYLYPLIRRWPTPSRSSETILVRKDGDSVVYLSDLRFGEKTALKFRMPITRRDLPAVQAAMGVEGLFDGYDYRGVHTLAYLAPIPNTPWRMVAKSDYSEILAELTYRSIMLVVFSVIMISLFLALGFLYYRSHERKLFDVLLEKEENYKVLFEQAQDGIFIVDSKGRILNVNPGGESMLGYSHHELIGHAMSDLYYGIDRSMVLPEYDPLHAGMPYVEERVMIKKDGTHMPVEFSRKIMPDGNMQKIVRDITERKKMEDALQKKDKELRTLVEKMDESFAIYELVQNTGSGGKDYRIIYANAAFKKIAGDQDVAGKTIIQVFPEYNREWFEICRNVLRTGESVRFEGYTKSVNKYVSVFVYRIEDGNSNRFGILFMDLSERRQMEKELQESKDLHAETEKSGKIGGWTIDVETMQQKWTEETFTIFEFESSHHTPNVPEGIELFAPSSRPMVEQAVKRAIEFGEPYDQECEIITVKGNRRWVHAIARIHWEDGKVKRISGSIQDITERKQAEESLAAREKEYNTLVETLDEGFCVIEVIFDSKDKAVDYRFLEINPAFIKQTGLTDPLKKTMKEMVPGIEDSWIEIYGKVAQTGESVRMEAPAAAMNRVFNTFAYRIGSEGSHKVGVIFSDITKRLEMEQLLRDVQRRESIGILSSGIAHDFNNLLAVMMGNVSLAQMNLPPTHSAAQNMAKALIAMENAAELTRQILAYSGKGNFQHVSIDLGKEIREHVSLFSISKPKNVKLETELPSTPIFIVGDPGQVKQVVMNLIINGGDAIGDNQGTVRVGLSSVTLNKSEVMQYSRITDKGLKPGDYALLDVSDNGVGMSREVMNKIFDPFFTTKFIGRGLGLSAVLGIIRAQEGGIMIDTEVGKGSRFSVILPMVAPPVTAEEKPEEVLTISESEMYGETILVIDDEPDVASMAREILEMNNLTVITEVNPLNGIEIYERHQKDIGLVLLDLTMPEMPGEKVAARLLEINPSVKIVISSGYSQSEVAKRIGSNLVAGFIQKPYHMNSLAKMIHSILHDGEFQER